MKGGMGKEAWERRRGKGGVGKEGKERWSTEKKEEERWQRWRRLSEQKRGSGMEEEVGGNR